MPFYEAALQTCMNKRKELSRYRILCRLTKEASLTASGSLTIEAAFVLPFFLMVIMSFLSLFFVMNFQLELQAAMDRAVQKAAAYYFAVDIVQDNGDAAEEIQGANGIGKDLLTGGITAAYLRAEILLQMDDAVFERAHVWGGKAGISFLQSKFPDEDGAIDLVVSYLIQIPFLPGEKAVIVMSQRSRRMVWTGSARWSNDSEADDGTEERIVYVTEHGSVYHMDLDCSHLRLNIQSVTPDEVTQLRNKDGGKYYPCEKCQGTLAGFYLYITESGDRYHNKLRCSGLTRNIKQILFSEVEGRAACSRCGS